MDPDEYLYEYEQLFYVNLYDNRCSIDALIPILCNTEDKV